MNLPRLILSSILLFFLHSLSAAESLYPLPTLKQQAQFNHLLSELRCLVCQNQDLADSNAGLAKDLRQDVYQRVKAGQSDQEIMTFLTERYGDFILFKPPLKGITIVLWSAPLIFVLFGLLGFWRRVARQPKEAETI